MRSKRQTDLRADRGSGARPGIPVRGQSKCPPGRWAFTRPHFREGDVMGESDSTASRPPKPVCDLDIRAVRRRSQVRNPSREKLLVTACSVDTYDFCPRESARACNSRTMAKTGIVAATNL